MSQEGLTPAEADRLRQLEGELRPLSPLVVAFSGGVDSSALLAVCASLESGPLLAVTGVSPSLARHQLEQARRVASQLGVPHLLLPTAELEDENYAANPANRCYFCKSELYGRLRRRLGPDWPHVVDGTNADDLADFRPGRAAAKEQGVKSPFARWGLGKDAIRRLSRRFGLETAEIPASPCLASRIPHGTRVTSEVLAEVERGEDALRELGLREFRLRHFGAKARIEIAAEELASLREGPRRDAVLAAIRAVGFAGVEIDPRPLRSGRLSEESA